MRCAAVAVRGECGGVGRSSEPCLSPYLTEAVAGSVHTGGASCSGLNEAACTHSDMFVQRAAEVRRKNGRF